jgi:serine/threonine protein kinase
MEYMSKGSLFNVLHSDEKLSWLQREQIALDIACGLAFLHAEKILHRDLKSLNVLLDNHFHASLTDFGLSKIKAETHNTMTKDGHPVGTPAWMAPELIDQPYTAKADIYSCGIVFWEISSRQVPYKDAPNPYVIPHWAAQEDKHDKIPQDTPPRFAKLIQWCRKPKAEERPIADEVVTELKSDSDNGNKITSSKGEQSSYRDYDASFNP